MEILETRSIYAGYDGDYILFDINLNIKRNSIYLIVGPNGSGKSTLLKVIAGMILPKKGKIYYMKKDITRLPTYERVKMGIKMMLQIRATYPYLSIKENLEIGGYYLKREILEEEIENLLELFPNFKNKLHTKAYSLSGGEQRLLELFMTLIGRPQLVLLDEPTAMLSPKYTNIILNKIDEIKDVLKITVVLVEQKISEAIKISEQLCIMDLGKLVYCGDKDDTYIRSSLINLFFG
jgi:branched-chain amino acid transport system ATP-binding protein